ncbi:hypothetical protein [Candidatus Solirubrobacter pratensis]|uniref:hypothetical protein n=1 Tax=Candidatus Solirubrobacter pratensis TaxID=1298857 RepID=UPI00048A2D48|nr:hypothetical protein [Candidatus Solirubrobacter pratensis]
MAGTTDLNGDKIRAYRSETFRSLGFVDDQVMSLVDAKGLDGFALSHHDVRRYLAQGATHEQIARIFS